jgi:hypothetical protein
MTSALTYDPICDRAHPITRGFTKIPIHGRA